MQKVRQLINIDNTFMCSGIFAYLYMLKKYLTKQEN